jgi:hypothetical protein
VGDLAHGDLTSPMMIGVSLDLCEIALKTKYSHVGTANMQGLADDHIKPGKIAG